MNEERRRARGRDESSRLSPPRVERTELQAGLRVILVGLLDALILPIARKSVSSPSFSSAALPPPLLPLLRGQLRTEVKSHHA